MIIDFTNLFNSPKEVLKIDYTIPRNFFGYGTGTPLKTDAKVVGKAYTKADVTHLDLNVVFDIHGNCARCLEEVVEHCDLDINVIVVSTLENEDDYDESIVVTDENNKVDVDEMLYQEIQLFLPHKYLCSDDCKGLCPGCGVNLNKEKCTCKKEVDPRMAALLQLLDEE